MGVESDCVRLQIDNSNGEVPYRPILGRRRAPSFRPHPSRADASAISVKATLENRKTRTVEVFSHALRRYEF